MHSTSCSVCGKNFSRQDNLRRHKRVAHGCSQPYQHITEVNPQTLEMDHQKIIEYPSIQQDFTPPPPPPPPGISQPYPPPPHGSSQPYPPPPHGSSQPYPPPLHGSSQPYPPPPPHGNNQPYPPPPLEFTQYPERTEESFKFHHPFTMLVAGPTMSGKSTFVKDLLVYNSVMIQPRPSRILWMYKRWQPMYDVIRKLVQPPVQFIQGLTDEIQRDEFINQRENNLVILDDIQRDASGSQDVCELFTEGAHHRNLSVICIMQNVFNKGKENRTINLNSQYLVLFKNPRDQLQINVLARQMYPGRTKKFIDMYRQATDKPFGYLVVDLKQTTPESKRLQTDIFRQYIKGDSLNQAHSVADCQGVQTDLPKAEQRIPDQQFKNMSLIPAYMDTFNHREKYEEKDKTPSCTDCGIMFNTEYDLQRHIKKGCPMNEDDDSNDEEIDMDYDEDEDNDEGYNFIVNEVWDEHSGQYDRKINKLLEDDEELSRDDAVEEASELMLSKDRSLFMKKYKEFLLHVYGLNASKLHRDIKLEISDLVKDQNIDVERACDLVIKRHKTDFNTLFDDYHRSDDDEDSDDEDESV
ncbi:hypothetical protein FSP39_010583 [Pinctada imbricata]|uniref:C2H2-type domain-containing protein n=1 Tax=Pinctada imbricata TaxID=66713 RepID=A0AA88XUZ9_PINIB|nr:hypothetical protein FSP39_010583 [Pinctada imbricata]